MGSIIFCRFCGFGEDAIKRSFIELGYTVNDFNQKTDNYDYNKDYMQGFLEKIEQIQPEFVFSINFFPIISKVCQVYKKPYICWVYDSPELHLYSSAITNSVNRIFLFDKIQYERFYQRSPKTVYYMPLATEPMSMEEMSKITNEEHKKYDCDVCFVGSLYREADKRMNDLERLPDYWRGYVEGLVNAQINVYGYNFIADSLSDEQVKELKKLLKYVLVDDYQVNDREIISDMYIGQLCTAKEREIVIRHLAKEHKIVLYTGSDTSSYKNVENRGVADSITMIPKIFHCSKINLNMTSKTIQSGIPLRVFDVLGCGGFLITNYQAEILDYFEPGVDLVTYESMEDLTNKVNYYLMHEEERKEIARNGYEKIKEVFTYQRAISDILEIAGI